jgi:hypothetical protein
LDIFLNFLLDICAYFLTVLHNYFLVLWDKWNDSISIKKEVSDVKFTPSCTSSPFTGTMRHNVT